MLDSLVVREEVKEGGGRGGAWLGTIMCALESLPWIVACYKYDLFTGNALDILMSVEARYAAVANKK